MRDSEPVTHYLEQCKAGDPEGARKLWDLYFRRLVGLARQRLAGRPAGIADGEDVALSAICGFIRGAEKGRFPELTNREQLWKLRAIAVWKMEGYTSEEIAGRLVCTLRTVERRLGLIRKLWSER